MYLLLFCGPVPSPEAMDRNTYLCTPDIITYHIIWFCPPPPPPPSQTMTEMNLDNALTFKVYS